MKIRDRIVELRRVSASELHPHPKNWRTHPKHQMDAMRGVLSEIGFAGAEIARELPDGSLQLIDGHARAEIAGDSKIPVLILDVDETEANKILATFDPIGALAETDGEKLDAVLRDVDTGNEALQEMLASLADEADLYLDDQPDVVQDETPEPPADPVTQFGDVWILGDHRVLCGDSTNKEHTQLLFDGHRADCCFTSPPYNAANAKVGAYAGRETATNKRKEMYCHGLDDMSREQYATFLASVLDLVAFHTTETAAVFWNVSYNANSRSDYGEIVFNHPTLKVRETIIWDKKTAMNIVGNHIYSRSQELVFLLSQSDKYNSNQSGGCFFNVWRIGTLDGDMHLHDHGATFPVALPTKGIMQHTTENQSVFDPFCGSGTTLIACEQLNRRCFGMELEPRYADLIVNRWENLTGNKAIHKRKDQVIQR